jgi:hypothetical protein
MRVPDFRKGVPPWAVTFRTSDAAEPIKTKIIREIAGRTPAAVIIPTQFEPRMNCSAGENPFWERWRN